MKATFADYALEHSPQPTLALDNAGVIVYANTAALELIQVARAQLIDHGFIELLNEGSVSKGQALLVAAQRGPTQLYELNQMNGAGEVMMIGYRAVPIPSAEQHGSTAVTLLFGQPLAQTIATTERLLALNRRHHALYTIAAAASRSLVLSDLLQRALDVTLLEMDFQAGAVLLNEDSTTHGMSGLRLVVQHGFASDIAERRPAMEQFLMSHQAALARGEPLLLNSETDDLGIDPADLTVPLGPLSSLAAVPLKSERQTQGWLLVLTDRYRAFNVGTMETLGTIGNLLGPVVANVHQVVEMNRLKDDFVAAAAHDLKTPVTAIKGYAQMSLRLAQREEWARLATNLDMINARSSELAQLIDAMLDMSRIQAGRLSLDAGEFDIHDLVEDVRDYFEFDLRRQKRELRVELSPTPLYVVWDQPRMARVLINLVGNALKYSPSGEPVTLQISPPNLHDDVELSVSDHGIGIAANERTRIFERFYRTSAVMVGGFKGTGLGLYIVAQIIAAHHGQIWVGDALHGGRGTTFHLSMPRTIA